MYQLELVTWHDAGEDEDKAWRDAKDVTDADIVIQSVGYVVKETEKNLTIAMDMADDGSTNGRSRIPKGMIVKREVLREKPNADEAK